MGTEEASTSAELGEREEERSLESNQSQSAESVALVHQQRLHYQSLLILVLVLLPFVLMFVQFQG